MLEQLTAEALRSVQLANNGYADIGNRRDVADAVCAAGLTVIATTNLHGAPVFRAFTPAAQAALKTEPFGVSTYRPVLAQLSEEPDFEAAILARQASHLLN